MKSVTKMLVMLLLVIASAFVLSPQAKAQVTLLTESFENGGAIPPNWATVIVAGSTNGISFITSGSTGYPSITVTPYDGSYEVFYNSYSITSGSTRLYRTAGTSTVGCISASVDFAMFHDLGYSGYPLEGITPQYSIDGGTNWFSAGSVIPRYNGTTGWAVHTVALPANAIGVANLRIAFLFTSYYGNNCFMDLAHLKGVIPTGNLTGTVRNCFTNATLAGVTVVCGGGTTVTNASGVYTLNAINSGPQTITATFAGFTPYSATVNVIASTTTTYNFCMSPISGILSGVVTNCANGNAVVGAKVVWTSTPNIVTYTTAGGAYSLNIYPGAIQNLQVSKEGFDLKQINGITVTPPATVTQNVCLDETAQPPSQPFTAALNAGQTAVNLNWGLPMGDMVLIYDDGIQDNFAIWATGAGLNMNAMKFTPISYPTIVKGFYVNIGTAANYPAGSNAFSPVQMAIYSEVGGLPGVQLSAPTTITPTVYGWTKTNFTAPVTIASGNFFIVMIQLGNSAASPGIAIDTTVQQLRSFSKFGATPWIPGPGNFMMRAVVNGTGGPLLMGDQSGAPITASAVPGLIYQYAPATITGVEGSPKVYPEMGYSPDNLLGYQVWRLLQGQTGNPLLWISVGTTTNTNIVDNSWPSLPCGPYQWAAEAQYTFNRWSVATFSNVLGKCWTCTVILNVDLSCDSATAIGALVKFQNLDVVDTVYTYTMTASGTHTFTNFWKGNYTLTVTKFDYTVFTQTYSIMGDMTINVMLLQIKAAPTGLHVVDSTLFANWFPPLFEQVFFNETFTGGFATNAWVPDAGGHWTIAGIGNPGQCAEWFWGPEVYNYSDALTSKVLVGNNSDVLKLRYDVLLNNLGNTTLEQLAVEVWDGTTWNSVKNYDNSSGSSMPWTTATIDITSVAPSSGFKVRFRAYGVDSYWINYWGIDNVKLIAQTAPHDPCIIGYNFYLNSVLDGYIPGPDTFYNIPPSHVTYGTAYHACVLAIYGSGYSTQSCYDFTSHFLCPPNTLVGVPIECTAYLTWQKPNCGGCTLATYQFETGILDNGFSAGAGNTYLLGNFFPVTPPTTTGIIKSFDINFCSTAGSTSAQSCILYIYDAAHTLIGQSAPFINTGAPYPSSTWMNVPINDVPYTGSFYGMVDYSISTAPYKNWFSVQYIAPAGYPNGMAYQIFNGTWGVAGPAFGFPVATFLQRANVCVDGKDKDAPITTIDPTPLPFSQPITPALGVAVNLGTNGSVDAGQPTSTPTPTPDAPDAITLLGYHVYRDGVNISPLLSPTTLSYYDYNLPPGTYSYKVNAWYNVSPFVPAVDNSQPAGPVSVTLSCGYPLPFFEPWTLGSFNYQSWSFAPSQGNWFMNTAVGDPAPCADFSWQPVITNYDLSLVSPTIDATAWTCADIFCDFDVKLVDYNATGTEKLDVDIFVGGLWQNKAVLSDSGSFDWTLKHINISSVMGKGFKVRFRAHGPNSANIQHWYVDNIHLYGVCRPPTSLEGKQNQFTTTLTWHSPVCPSSCTLKSYIYDNGGPYWNALSINTGFNIYQGNFFPLTASATGIIKSFDVWFTQYSIWTTQSCVLYLFDAAQNPIGQSAPFQNGPAATWPSGTWVNIPIPDIPYTGAFFAMIDYNATSVPKNGMGWDDVTIIPGQPDGLAWGWQDGVFTPADQLFGYPAPQTYSQRANVCESSSKDKDAPITVLDPSKMKYGKFVPGAATPPTGPQPAGWKNSINNYQQGNNIFDLPNSPAGSQLLGYNVYRTHDDSINGNFYKINGAYVPDTTYQDIHPNTTHLGSSWKYYVTVVFQDSLNPGDILCEPHSDTIMMNFQAVGINDPTNSSISLYPNPANDVVYIVSTNDIKTIEVLNYIGQTVYMNNSVNLKKAQLNVTNFKSGVYFVKITTTSGIKTTKITVTH